MNSQIYYIKALLKQFLSENEISRYLEHMGDKLLPDSEKEIEENVKKALEYGRKKD